MTLRSVFVFVKNRQSKQVYAPKNLPFSAFPIANTNTITEFI